MVLLSLLMQIALLTSIEVASGQEASPPGDAAPPMRTVNFFRDHENEYIKPAEPTVVEIGPARYLAIEGAGPPDGEDFQQAMPALFGVGVTVRAMCQQELNLNFGIGVVDALWWAEDENAASFLSVPREVWRWKVMMRVPAEVTEEMVARAVESMKARQANPGPGPGAGAGGTPDLRSPEGPGSDVGPGVGRGVQSAANKTERSQSPLDRLKLETIEEGTCIQMLHTGPYDKEQPNIEWMHRFAREQGYEIKGRHHEIYLNSPQTTLPLYLKTILRQPVERKGQ